MIGFDGLRIELGKWVRPEWSGISENAFSICLERKEGMQLFVRKGGLGRTVVFDDSFALFRGLVSIKNCNIV